MKPWLIVTAFVLVGCAAATSTPSPVPTAPPSATAAPTATVAVPSATPTVTAAPPSPTPLPLATMPLIATATPTSAPPSATPTPPPATPTRLPLAQIFLFMTSHVSTNAIGDRFTLSWQATGQQAQLCPLFGTGPVDTQCVDVPIAGSRTITVTQDDLQWIGYVLRVRRGEQMELATVRVNMQCRGFREWFTPNPPLRCPAAEAQFSPAAFGRFEHGFMVWTAQPDAFYVFNTDAQQTVDIYTAVQMKPGASPDNRTGETPPAGRFEPVSGFGMLWRGEFANIPAARARLGWALEKEYAFTSGYQCELPAYPRLWNCFIGGPGGTVYFIRPDSTAGVRVLWNQVEPR